MYQSGFPLEYNNRFLRLCSRAMANKTSTCDATDAANAFDFLASMLRLK
jgi:hypothetical protein